MGLGVRLWKHFLLFYATYSYQYCQNKDSYCGIILLGNVICISCLACCDDFPFGIVLMGSNPIILSVLTGFKCHNCSAWDTWKSYCYGVSFLKHCEHYVSTLPNFFGGIFSSVLVLHFPLIPSSRMVLCLNFRPWIRSSWLDTLSIPVLSWVYLLEKFTQIIPSLLLLLKIISSFNFNYTLIIPSLGCIFPKRF